MQTILNRAQRDRLVSFLLLGRRSLSRILRFATFARPVQQNEDGGAMLQGSRLLEQPTPILYLPSERGKGSMW
jgi:hypothetical protein